MKQSTVKSIVILGVLSVSVVALVVKSASAPKITQAFYRLAMAFAMLAPVVVHRHRGLPRMDRASLVRSVLSGVAMGIHFLAWFVALDYTTVANATVLTNASSIFALLGGAVFLQEPLSRREVVCVGSTFLGAVLIAWESLGVQTMESFGVGLSMLSALMLAAYMLLGRSVRSRYSNLDYTFVVYGTATVFLGAANALLVGPFAGFSADNWLVFLYLAVFPTLLGHSVFTWSLRYVKAAFPTTMLLFVPVISSVGAWILFGETPAAIEMLGAVVILVSLFAYTRGKAEQEERDAAWSEPAVRT